MGKANLAKKKQWRRIPSSVPEAPIRADFEAKAASSLPEDRLFVLDKSGDHSLAKGYPERFCRPKSSVPSVHPKSAASKTPQIKGTPGLFDLWDSPSSAHSKPEVPLSHIPAVIPPLPGQSYNPSAASLSQAWSRVLSEEEDKEMAKMEYRQAVHGFQVVEKDAQVASDDETMGQDLLRNAPTLNRKPSKKKMNRKVRWLLQEREKEQEKNRKKLLKQVDLIPKLLAEEAQKQREHDFQFQELQKRQRETKEAEAAGRKAPKLRMGQYVYALPDTEAVYSEEPKPLRLMQPKATAVSAAFDSLVRRGRVDLSQPKRLPKMVTKAKLTGEKSREMQEARKQKQAVVSSGTIPMPKA